VPEYVCRLGTAAGDVVERVMTSDSEQALRQELAQQDLLVLAVRRRFGMLASLPGRRRRVPATEFLVFNQELMALIRAGLPILSSLDLLIERRKHQGFKHALITIRDQIKSGSSLSEAFEAQGDLFPRLYAASLASGERSGEIATVLQRYIDYTRTVAAIRRRVIGAAIYPVILLTVMIIVIGVIVGFVFPKFAGFFDTMKADLPIMTVLLLKASNWFSTNMVWVLLGIPLAGGALFSWARTPAGRTWLDGARLRLPLIGEVFQKYALTRFTRTLGTLTAGGIPVVTALQIAARTVGNTVFTTRLEEAARKVREGQALWQALEETGMATDMAIEMVRVGESTGALTEMLENISSFHEAEIDQRVQTLVTLMEPILLLCMAVVIGILLLTIYMPLLSSFSNSAM